MKVLVICLSLLSGMVYAQRAQFSAYMPFDSPYKAQMPYMSTNTSMAAGFGMKLSQNCPIYLELKGSLGSYAAQTLEQTYIFENGDKTETDVTYISKMSKMMFGAKYVVGNDYQRTRLYVTPQIGYASMRSTIRVADPEDEDDCQPLEKKTTQRDVGAIYGGEIGMEIALNGLFKGPQDEYKHRLLLAFSFARGFAPFEYVNVKYMESGTLEEHNSLDHTNGTRDINAQFINVSTNSIHEHKISELYRTNYAMWGIQVGYIVTF